MVGSHGCQLFVNQITTQRMGFVDTTNQKAHPNLGFVVVYNHLVFVDIINQTTMYHLGFVAT